MYEVTTGNLNKTVKRNIDRFPDDFMFQLTNEEFDLIFQNGTSSWGGTRKLPYAVQRYLSGLDRNGKPKRKKSKTNKTDWIFGVRKIKP